MAWMTENLHGHKFPPCKDPVILPLCFLLRTHRASVVNQLEVGFCPFALPPLWLQEVRGLAQVVIKQGSLESRIARLGKHALLFKDGEDAHGLLGESRREDQFFQKEREREREMIGRQAGRQTEIDREGRKEKCLELILPKVRIENNNSYGKKDPKAAFNLSGEPQVASVGEGYLFQKLNASLEIETKVNEDPVDAFSLVFLLLQHKHVVVEKLLQLFVGEVDAELFKAVTHNFLPLRLTVASFASEVVQRKRNLVVKRVGPVTNPRSLRWPLNEITACQQPEANEQLSAKPPKENKKFPAPLSNRHPDQHRSGQQVRTAEVSESEDSGPSGRGMLLLEMVEAGSSEEEAPKEPVHIFRRKEQLQQHGRLRSKAGR
ncbi:hypothetical protein L345_14201, partial [Ophiophagus hannah]